MDRDMRMTLLLLTMCLLPASTAAPEDGPSRRPQNSIAEVHQVEPGTVSTAHIDGNDSIHAGFPVEVFELRATGEGGLTAELQSPDFEPYLVVQEPDGFLIYVEAAADDTCRYNLPDAREGVYRFYAGPAYAGDRGRLLFVARTYSRGPAADEVPAVELGFGRNEGRIEVGAPEYGGKRVAVFERQTGTNERLRFALESDDFDAYLYVVTPDGDVLSDDDGLGDLNSVISVESTSPGTYRIYASSYDGISTGSFTLRMSRY